MNRFFTTLLLLFSNPGFLSAEYKKGNRSYINPLLLLLVTAALFFIIFYTVFKDQNIYSDNTSGTSIVKSGTIAILKESYKNAKKREDSIEIQKAIRKLEDSTDKDNKREYFEIFELSDTTYKTVAAYDSQQRLLPAEKRDDWITSKQRRGAIITKERYDNNVQRFWRDISNQFIHYFPYLVFILLPLNALFFKLIYIRKKQFSYIDHSIFLVHVYEMLFILMLLYLGVLALRQYTTIGRMVLTVVAILVFGFIYTTRAMKKFYEQSWAKTIFKFILFNLLCITALLAAFIVWFGISISWL